MWNEEIIRQRVRKESKTLYISTACYSDKTNLMLQELRERISISPNKTIKESFWELADDHSPFEWVNNIIRRQQKGECLYSKNDCLATMEALNYYNKLNTEKEKEKMNAKRCDRCGKLYMEDHEQIHVYLCGRVNDGEKKTYTPEKIKEFNTYHINVVINSSNTMDMCPDCCKKLKEFFESGADEAKEN